MVLVKPEKGVGDEEIGYLVPPVVEYERAPFLLLAFKRVCVLVKGCAVEICEAVGIPREMGRNPVHDYADARPVHRIDEIHEVVGRPEPARAGEVAYRLVAP